MNDHIAARAYPTESNPMECGVGDGVTSSHWLPDGMVPVGALDDADPFWDKTTDGFWFPDGDRNSDSCFEWPA